MCRPALSVYSEFHDFARLFSDISSRQGDHITMASSLSPNTIPYELAERIVHELDNSDWKAAYQETFEQISLFEGMLKDRQYIEIVRLATVEEVRSGNVYIASPYKTQPEPPVCTPETYILHLKNILRLMDQYENYYFIPYNESGWENYNLIVNSDGLALLVRTCEPPLMLEMQRPELVMACHEHLLRKAEKIGYDGIHKETNRRIIQKLIKELQR